MIGLQSSELFIYCKQEQSTLAHSFRWIEKVSLELKVNEIQFSGRLGLATKTSGDVFEQLFLYRVS